MDLVRTAVELLTIKQIYKFYLDPKQLEKAKIRNVSDDDFDIHSFEQVWGNTSGGFEGFGGSAMTPQNTYVLVPRFKHDCLIFFGGKFAYKVPYSQVLMDDIKRGNIAGRLHYGKYLKN